MPRGVKRTPKERASLLAAYKKAPAGKKVAWLKKMGLSTATIYRYRAAAKGKK